MTARYYAVSSKRCKLPHPECMVRMSVGDGRRKETVLNQRNKSGFYQDRQRLRIRLAP